MELYAGIENRESLGKLMSHVNEISVVGCNDNSVVTVATNVESVQPLVPVRRFNRKKNMKLLLSN